MSCRPGERGHRLRHDLAIAGLATVGFVLLSLPAHWSFDSAGEAGRVWVVYFAVGAVLSLYVVLAFMRATRMLLGHQHEEVRRDRP